MCYLDSYIYEFEHCVETGEFPVEHGHHSLSGHLHECERRLETPKKTNWSAPNFNYVDGSIFDAVKSSQVEGIAIFVPFGMTALRVTTFDFVQTLIPMPLECEGDFKCYRTQEGKLVYAYKEGVESIQEMMFLVNKICTLFSKHNIHSFAMNGIRARDFPLQTGERNHVQEYLLVEFVRKWCELKEHSFNSISFVDLRGGFNSLAH